jgi:hypothetical protein
LDNDCDGAVDEGGVCPTSPPVVMCPGAITAQVLSTVSLAGSGSDPDGGTVTYRWTVTGRPTGSVSNPSSPNSASTNFYLDASGSYTLQLCVTDDEGQSACCTMSVTSTPPGAIHVELSWSTAYGDVDLHFLNVNQSDPTGWWSINDCHWLNQTPDWGALGAVANPTLDIDDTDGYGPENTTITNMPQTGNYTIGVHFYCSHSIARNGGPAIAPGDGPTTGTARIFCNGTLIQTVTGIRLDRTDDWVTLGTVSYPTCRYTATNRATTGNQTLPTSITSIRHCPTACARDSDCRSLERCATSGPLRGQCYLSR